VSNGWFQVQGAQTGTGSGQRTNLGPFAIPFGSVTDISELDLVPGTTTIPIPEKSGGVAIIPPIGAPPAGVTLAMKTVPGDSGIRISTAQPTFLEWDEANEAEPANLYLVVGVGNITVTVQFL
jgi:hypothetical protein